MAFISWLALEAVGPGLFETHPMLLQLRRHADDQGEPHLPPAPAVPGVTPIKMLGFGKVAAQA